MSRVTAFRFQGNDLRASVGMAIASLSVAPALQATEAITLGEINVEGEQGGTYQVKKLSSAKYSQPLRDVAQSVSVVPKELIEKQNAQTLEEVLQNVAGITFNSGEGAGGVGDSINIRGFNSGNYGGSNVFVDGVRESAYYTRSEMFNTEQVEVVKGSSSSAWGAGVIGGAINMVSKTAQDDDFNRLSVGVGTAEYKRLTLDSNRLLDADRGIAARLNLVGIESGVNGRDWIERERWGIAPTITFGLGTATRVDLGYEHLNDRGNYDYGVPTSHSGDLDTRNHGGSASKAPGVKWDSYWGYRNLDKENNKIDRFNFKVEHDFNDALSLSNQFTYAQLKRDYVVTTPEGSYLNSDSAGNGSGRRLVGVARHTENKTFSNQTNLTWKVDTLGIAHTLVGGLEYTREKLDQKNGGLRYGNQGNGTTAVNPASPPSRFDGNTELAYTAHTNAESETKAFYLLDTLKFNEQWQADVSARRDFWSAQNNKVEYRTNTDGVLGDWTSGTAGGRGSPAQPAYLDKIKEKLFSYRAALTYKPVEYGSFYVAYGNAKQPSSIGASTAGGISETDAAISPTKGKTYEVGSKWDLFDETLSLSGAIFRTELDGPLLSDSSDPLSEQVRIKSRVEGVELAASGNLSDDWGIFASYSYMKSKILDDGRDAGGSFDNPAANETGIELPNTPKHSASLWTSYKVDNDWSLDYGVRYVGERYVGLGRGQAVTSASRAEVPSYVVHNAAVSWQANKELGLRLNLTNLFNKHYWRQYNGRGFGVPGEGRGAQLTASYSF